MNSTEIQLFMLLLKIYCQPDRCGVCEWKGLGVPAFEGSICFEVQFKKKSLNCNNF